MLDVYRIREDFPILNTVINGKKLVYLDNAATTHKPLHVIRAVEEFYTRYNSNIHRGLHALSQKASELYEEAHEIVASFIGADKPEEIIFVRNTTEAINLVAYAWGLENIREGDEILVSTLNHHSSILPWLRIARLRKARVNVVGVTREGRLDYEDFEEKITRRTKIVSIVHMSNVTGAIVDVEKIAKTAHDHGALVVVDGAQSVPHIPVNAKKLGIDFLAFSGHKMLGPTGIGVLFVDERILDELGVFITGGGAVKGVHYRGSEFIVDWADPPWVHEAGTPHIAGAIGLSRAIEYLSGIGMENIYAHEKELVEKLFKLLEEKELSDKISILGPRNIRGRGGIVSFTLSRLDPHATAILLDKEGIAVRSGFHCAQPLHEELGFTRGSVRASLYLYNTMEEIEYFVDVLEGIVSNKQQV